MQIIEMSVRELQKFVKDQDPCEGACGSTACAFAKRIRMLLKTAPRKTIKSQRKARS